MALTAKGYQALSERLRDRYGHRRRHIDPIALGHPHTPPEPFPSEPLANAEAWVNRQLARLSGSARLLARVTLAEVVLEEVERGGTNIDPDWCGASERLRHRAWDLVHSVHRFTQGEVSIALPFDSAAREAWAHDLRQSDHGAALAFWTIRHLLDPRFLSSVFYLWDCMARLWFEPVPPRLTSEQVLSQVGHNRLTRQRERILRTWWRRWQCRLATAAPSRFQFEHIDWLSTLETCIEQRDWFSATVVFVDWHDADLVDDLVTFRRWRVREQAVRCAERTDSTWEATIERVARSDRSARVREAADEWLHEKRLRRAARRILDRYRPRRPVRSA